MIENYVGTLSGSSRFRPTKPVFAQPLPAQKFIPDMPKWQIQNLVSR